MARKLARKGKVTIGTYQIAEMGFWSMSGMRNTLIEVSEFGDEFEKLDFGMGSYGTITVRGNYDPTDANGQALIESAWKNKSKLTDLRCWINSVSYYVPDLTNDSDSAVLIEEFGAIEYDKAGVGKVQFTGRVSGQMVLE